MTAQAVARDNPVDVGGEAFGPARAELENLIGSVTTPVALRSPHGEIEELIKTKGLEVLRLVLQGHVDVRGPGRVVGNRVQGADGVVRGPERVRPRRLLSLFGLVVSVRLAYSEDGLPSLCPKDADLNLPTGLYSHGVERAVAEHASKVSFEETVKFLKQQTGAPVAKRQVEELAVRAAQDFEPYYESRKSATGPQAQEKGPLMVLSGDGKGLRMHLEDLRPDTKKAAEERIAEKRERFTLGQESPGRQAKESRKRMAEVAAVFTLGLFVRTPEDVVGELQHVRLVNEKRPRPEDKTLFVSVTDEPDDVLELAFGEGLRRDPDLVKRWAALVDGNEGQIDAFEALAKTYGVTLTIVVDFIHVCGYLWGAAHAFHERGSKDAENWTRERMLEVLRGHASLVAAGMRRSATMREMKDEQRKPVDKCANYLLKYAPYLHYDEYLRDGLPIATGVIEGACRYLVKDRMEITGAIWGLESAEAVLKLRALRSSGDFDEYWQFHQARDRERNHDVRYADHKLPELQAPPTPATPARRHLRLVQ